MKGEQEDGKLFDRNGKNDGIEIYSIIFKYYNIIIIYYLIFHKYIN